MTPQGLGARSFEKTNTGTAVPASTKTSLEQQERVSRKRVVRLMQEDGLKARVRKRYKRTTMSDDQPVAAICSTGSSRPRRESTVGRRHDRVRHRDERQALPGGDPRSILAVRRRLGGERRERSPSDDQGARDGLEATVPRDRLAASLRSRVDLCERGLPRRPGRPRHHLQHEPSRQLLRQCGDGKLLSTVKSELADQFASNGDAKMELFDYIEVFYNQRRRHSTLGQISPAAFERRHTQAA